MQISEIYSISEIDQSLIKAEGNLFLFDIDDTIISPKSMSFRNRKNRNINVINELKANKEKYPNFEQILSKWRLSRKVILIEEIYPGFIEELKKKHIVYGFTLFDTGHFGLIDNTEDWRINELSKLGVKFSDSPNKIILGKREESAALIKEGIIFTGQYPKEAIADYIIKIGPKKIIFIDDKLENLESVGNKIPQGFEYFPYLYLGNQIDESDLDQEFIAHQRKMLLEQGIWIEE